MAHVFISYVRENREEVDRLCQELTKHRVKVWRDRDNIYPGMRWKQAIRPAISNELIDGHIKLGPQITMAREYAKQALSDALKRFNELNISKLSSTRIQKQAIEYLRTYRFRFDGQYNVVNSDRVIIFHDVELVIGLQYSRFIRRFDDILSEHVIGKDAGSIKWVDILASDYRMIDPAYNVYRSDFVSFIKNIDWLRLNVAPFSYFQSWDWYILVESHIMIPKLAPEDIGSYANYLQSKGWLIL